MEVERVCAVAWGLGGNEAEREAKAAYHSNKDAETQRNMDAWAEMRRKRAEDGPVDIKAGMSITVERSDSVPTHPLWLS